MKSLPLQFKRTFLRAVYGVSEQRVPDGGHMYTDLMCPPRLQRKFAESIIPEAPEYTVMCNGLFSPGLYDSHLFPVLRISPDIALDRSGIVPDNSAYDAVIDPRHRMYLELFGDLSVCRVVLADDERSGRVFIDPMDDARPQNVPSGCPGAGCTVIPLGLLTIRRSLSS